MKKNILTLLAVCALAIGAKAQTELPLLPASHGMLGNQPAFTAQQQQEFPMMATGWNWWSSYIDLSDDGLSKLETALGDNATIIKSRTNLVSYDADLNIWVGPLTELSNDQMYMIEMNVLPVQATRLESRYAMSTSDVEIVAHRGWSWVGFPSKTSVNINDAMAEYSLYAVEGDVVKSLSEMATFDGTQWIGELTSLNPGFGYMIQNNGDADVPFHFSQGSRFESEPEVPTRWIASSHSFPTNMTMMAVINFKGEELRSSNFEVAAYVGDDCRGTVVPQYVESLDRYIAFLTIAGEERDDLQFRLLDYDTDLVYVADNRYNYSIDAVEGSLKNPYFLYFNTCLGLDEYADAHMKVFPNPIESGNQVTLVLPATSKTNMMVEVVNMLGVVVKRERVTQSVMKLSMKLTPGVYNVKVVDSDKQLYIEKLIVK